MKRGIITLDRMIELMAETPRRIFGIAGGIKPGDRADLTIVDFDQSYIVDPEKFLSKGKSTPFEGQRLYGVVKATISSGKIAYIAQ